MCTIALAWRTLADAPVAVAANRDEALDRPSRPPGVLDEDPTVVAPQDAEAGGTWIGVSERGLVVAITNRKTDLDDDRSRGLLVRDALSQPDAEAAVEFVRDSVRNHRYAGFNLLVVDADSATYFEWDGSLSTRELEPGVHVIGNAGLGDADDRAVQLRDALDSHSDESAADWLDRATAALGDHDYEVCVHCDGFGTRSASFLRVGDDGSIAYRYADGPPCETDARPVELPASILEASF